MKANLTWKSAMLFDAEVSGNHVEMDAKAPLGKGAAATPKELVAIGMGGCTAMDVVALLKKYKQLPTSFALEVDVTPTEGQHPAVFARATISYIVNGEVEDAKLIEAVHLSQTKYCGVSAMLSKAFPIDFKIILNGKEINSGHANFQT